ncbi:histidine phosphatase family protein [Eisenibacter elegans]|jgi:probable phosphoglycerate mutase|uniref:histidine phosphatase family protein n=1 Tax=Eisenibacter elegans TaxID=997 RepID=UPI00041CD412|nr:histidine phosphatase family protein [Eisenibacter elegans]
MQQTIYLIRHGQTEFNRQNIVQGSGVDAPLNELGQRQAEAFFETYKHIPFDRIYTSALQRAIQSVAKFTALGIPTEHYAGLNEISWGVNEGHPVDPEQDRYYHDMLRSWREGRVDIAIQGGESPIQVQERQRPILELIRSRPEDQNILIAMHGRAMRILLCLMLNAPLQEMDNFEHQNLCLYQLVYTGSMFRIERYNDTSHLSLLEA